MNSGFTRGLQHFVWDETSTAQDYDEYMEVFDNTMIMLKIVSANSTDVVEGFTGSTRAKAALIAACGPVMLKSIRSIADYKTLTYTALRLLLDAEYVGVTPLQALSRFNRCKPKADEKFTDFIKRLKLLAAVCTRGDDKSMLAHISQHYPCAEIAKECMKENMTVTKLVTYAVHEELNEKEYQPEISKSELNRIQYDKRTANNASYIRNKYNPSTRGGKNQQSRPRNNSENSSSRKKCNKCDRVHGYGECRAYGEQCHNCLLKNHFARCCRNAKVNDGLGGQTHASTSNPNLTKNSKLGAKPNQKKPKSFIHNHINDDSSESESETFFIRTRFRRINGVNKVNESSPTIEITINGTKCVFIIDTGAPSNLMSAKTYFKLVNKPKLTASNKRMYGYNSDEQIPILGTFETEVTINGITSKTMFYVVNDKKSTENLLGHPSLKEFKIVEIMNQVTTYAHCIEQKFKKLFENRIGKMIGVKVSILTNPDVKPSQQPHYQVPYHLIPGTKEKLQELISNEILEKVDENTKVTWISPMLPVQKGAQKGKSKTKGIAGQQREMASKSSIRITSDNKKLNKAIIRRPRPMPSLQTLTYDLNGKKWFSKVDIRDAFNQLELDEASKVLTTFVTPWGLYRYRRLNMGLCIASELFQEILQAKLADLKCIKVAIDDILVYAETEAEHDAALDALLTRLMELNLTCKLEKCEFKKSEIEFFGMHISADGIKPKDTKINDFRNASVPTEPKTLRSFLGLATYFSSRLPKLATTSECLRDLLRKGATYDWTEVHEKAFQEIKTSIIDKCLAHFDPKRKTQLWVDAGPWGTAAYIIQLDENGIGYLVSCASRSFSKSERNYSQVEKEAFAAMWGCEHYHIYLYGGKFDLVTDNRAVSIIFDTSSESRARTPIRLQLWRSRLTQYDFKTKLVKSEDNISDYLSRCLASEKQEPQSKISKQYFTQALVADTEERVNKIIEETTSSFDLSIKRLISLSLKDNFISKIKNLIKINHRIPLTAEFKGYRAIASELSISEDGLLMKGDKIVLPKEIWNEVIECAHKGHMGAKMCAKLIKENYYFPDIEKLVNERVLDCEECDANTDTSKLNPILSSTMPTEAWKLIAIDFSSRTPTGEYVLVIICEHSRYPVLKLSKNLTSKEVIRILKLVFLEFGYPQAIKSDNGPAFISREFANFCENNRIAHCKITPLWPRANGLCERFMRNLNKIIRCSSVSKQCWKNCLAKYLANYRATPHSSTNVTPNQLMKMENSNGMVSQNKLSNKDYKRLALENDKKSKISQKTYADIYLSTKSVVFKKDDIVKLKWDRKSSKFLPLFDPQNYIVTNVNGTMITAVRDGVNPITRNSSFFKHATSGQLPNDLDIEKFTQKFETNFFELLEAENFKLFENEVDLNRTQPLNESTESDSNDDLLENSFMLMQELDKVVNEYNESDDESKNIQNDPSYELPIRSPISECYSSDSSASIESQLSIDYPLNQTKALSTSDDSTFSTESNHDNQSAPSGPNALINEFDHSSNSKLPV